MGEISPVLLLYNVLPVISLESWDTSGSILNPTTKEMVP